MTERADKVRYEECRPQRLSIQSGVRAVVTDWNDFRLESLESLHVVDSFASGPALAQAALAETPPRGP